MLSATNQIFVFYVPVDSDLLTGRPDAPTVPIGGYVGLNRGHLEENANYLIIQVTLGPHEHVPESLRQYLEKPQV
ncbi:MAG: hypothetical protein J4428_00310 [Candidatus Aenigmarchaeota archaeon]|nr:hypothetical protein [Candidatus Aenigmarchaeota archaeon]